MSALRLCRACRYQVVPARPQPFAKKVRSSGSTDSVNEHLDDEYSKRKIEEQRIAEGYPLDSEPQFHPWCRELTMSEGKARKICNELVAGDDTNARAALREHRIVIDYANGIVLPIYISCTRANPAGDCDRFKAR
jgi:hypothetical protein